MTDIFFSYSREDKDRVAFIAAALEAEGYTLWWDAEIAPGETYRRVTQTKLREAKCVIVVWSQTSVHSRWVIGEAEEGLHREILLPIMIDDVLREVPIDFRSVQAANLTRWSGDRNDPEWKKIVGQVQRLIQKPAKRAKRYRKPKPSNPGGGRSMFGMALFIAIMAVGVWSLYWSAERLRHQQEEQELASALERVSDIDLELIQRALNALGYRAGEVTNETGPDTRNAIRRFQTNLAADDPSLSQDEQQATVTGALTPQQTVVLFRQAAQSGHPMSQYVYGVMFIRGMGVLQDGAQGVEWLQRAADANLAIAHYALGIIYRDGVTGSVPVEPDAGLARLHFARATALGYAPAGDALVMLDFERVSKDTTEPADSSSSTDPAAVASFTDCTQCPEMVVVPAGTFRMGDMDSSGYSDEKPVHAVTMAKSFAVGVYEVTFDEWDACIAARGCGNYRPSDEGWGRERRPVMNVSWEDAQAYVAWLTRTTGNKYRLLSEAEWEYAARAGEETKYHFGDLDRELCDYSNGADLSKSFSERNTLCNDGHGDETAVVGAFLPNNFGLHDVHGNVREWVLDCYKDDYLEAAANGEAWHKDGCTKRVLRGGGWNSKPKDMRSSMRYVHDQTYQNSTTGFRVAKSLE